jgi:hypothetical protein
MEVKNTLLSVTCYISPYFIFFLLYAHSDPMNQPICKLNGSNNAVCVKNVPFGGGVNSKLHLGVENPHTPFFVPEFPA